MIGIYRHDYVSKKRKEAELRKKKGESEWADDNGGDFLTAPNNLTLRSKKRIEKMWHK